MVFFRVHHPLSEPYRPDQHGLDDVSRRAAAVLCDPWLEWEGLDATGSSRL